MDDVRQGVLADLFSHKKSDTQLFGRIHDILAARLVNGRLLLEIFVQGPMPPLPWFRSVTCEVRDPDRGTVIGRAAIESANLEEPGYVTAYTAPLEGDVPPPDLLPPRAIVRILSPSGMRKEHLLCPLLHAKP